MTVERYSPLPVADIQDVYRELLRISSLLDTLIEGQMEARKSEPERPRVGMVVFADGVSWNPGLGMGVYSYEGSSTASASWTKL